MQAASQDRELLRTLRWYDGFVIALANPGFLVAFLGYSIGALGGWAAVALWAVSMLIGASSNWVYSEMAAMFPDKPGGIALYAHEGWRRYFSLVGPVATFGYWFAWSSVLSVFGLVIGSLIERQWFAGQDWSFSTGLADNIGLGHVIGGGLVIAVCLVNVFGIRPAVWLSYLTGAMLVVLLAVFIVVNLFIAVILNNLETVKAEHAAEDLSRHGDEELLRRVERLRAEVADVEALLRERVRGTPAT